MQNFKNYFIAEIIYEETYKKNLNFNTLYIFGIDF